MYFFDFINCLFLTFMFFYNYNHRPLYGLTMFIAFLFLILYISFYIKDKKQRKSTILDLNRIIAGILVFLNPNLGTFIGIFYYFIIAILHLRFFQ